MSNCSLNITSTVLVLQNVTSIPMFVLGVLGNTYVLVVFIRRPRAEWTYMNVYITNMAVADFVLLAFLPVKIHYYDRQLEHHLRALCNFTLSVYYVNTYVSIFTITAISVVRYVAIKYPMKAREVFSCRKAVVVCVLIWVSVCSISPVYFVADSSNDKTMCFQRVKDALSLHFVLLLVVLGFLVPFLIMLFCSVRVIFTLSRQLRMGSRQEKIQSMLIMAANFFVFLVCFFPVHVGYVIKYVVQNDHVNPDDNYSCRDKQVAHNFLHATLCISSMNCGLDCFSYFFATKTTSCNTPCSGQSARPDGETDYTAVSSPASGSSQPL